MLNISTPATTCPTDLSNKHQQQRGVNMFKQSRVKKLNFLEKDFLLKVVKLK